MKKIYIFLFLILFLFAPISFVRAEEVFSTEDAVVETTEEETIETEQETLITEEEIIEDQEETTDIGTENEDLIEGGDEGSTAEITEINDNTESENESSTIEEETIETEDETLTEAGNSIPIPVVQETILIRKHETVVYDSVFDFPSAGTLEIQDSDGVLHEIDTQSVLGVLSILDMENDTFALSDIVYYESFDSLYLKCVVINTEEFCDNWQFVVNSITPWTSIDSTVLSGGETIGLYFGNQHQVSLDTISVTKGESITAIAETYNYIDNTWGVRTNVSIGVTTPNPDDPWNPIVLMTVPVDSEGKAVFAIENVGTYSVGIAEDYYFPSYTITVVESIVSGSGGGGGVSIPAPMFNVESAVSYLLNKQSLDGSFGANALYTDWAVIALASKGISSESKEKALEYFHGNNATPLLTDIERRSLALLSLGENPYDFAGTDYVQKIIDSFDGMQFGDPSLVNDDIFALVPLSAVGYSWNDEIIQKDINFLVSKQRSDGSWEGSVDLTAAAIQAIIPFNGTSNAIQKAIAYLKDTQISNGSFGNVYATSWAVQAIGGGKKNGVDSLEYLTSNQYSDGGVLPFTETEVNRIWATSYAIPAVLEMTWSDIMHKVTRPIIEQESANASIIAPESIKVFEEEKIEQRLEESGIVEGGQEEVPEIAMFTAPENPAVSLKEVVPLMEEDNPLVAIEALTPPVPLVANVYDGREDVSFMVLLTGIAGIFGLAVIKVFRILG